MNMKLHVLLVCGLLALTGPAQALDLWGSVKGVFSSEKSKSKAEEAKTEEGETSSPPAAQPAAAVTTALDPAPGVADREMEAFLDQRIWPKKDLAAMKKVVVGGFRVAIATKATVSDSVRASYLPGGINKSGVNSKIELTLEGIDLQRMQALVDKAYQDFLAQLKANSVELIPYADFAAHPSFTEIEAAKQKDGQPYTVTHEGRTYVVLSPSGMKLWFDQAEALGDQGAFGWGNGRRAGDFAFDNQALVLNPLLVVDFAETASARNKGLFGVRDESDVEAKAGMSLRKSNTLLYVRGRAAPIASAVMGGVAPTLTLPSNTPAGKPHGSRHPKGWQKQVCI
jgi:hypothetical protein